MDVEIAGLDCRQDLRREDEVDQAMQVQRSHANGLVESCPTTATQKSRRVPTPRDFTKASAGEANGKKLRLRCHCASSCETNSDASATFYACCVDRYGLGLKMAASQIMLRWDLHM